MIIVVIILLSREYSELSSKKYIQFGIPGRLHGILKRPVPGGKPRPIEVGFLIDTYSLFTIGAGALAMDRQLTGLRISPW